LSLHGLRHTHATIALRAGVHPKVVSERLGHASVAFTLDTYTDALPDMQETAASLVAALVFDKPEAVETLSDQSASRHN
jgi:integrase